MQDLQVIGVENGALLVASDGGERFRIPIDEVMQSRLRQVPSEPSNARKVSPREIQSQIRAGHTTQEVAEATGASVEYIEKFEGPVLAEREFVVSSALAVAVHTAADVEPGENTFGSVMTTRLHGLGATDERWASWKDAEAGWMIKLTFTANDIEHDARWTFDPRKSSLSPSNAEAITLSQQGEAPSTLIPRLRAVSSVREPDNARFDSGAFDITEDSLASAAPTNRFAAAEDPVEHNQTADLLDALRRRRGEREAASYSDDDAMSAHPSTGSIRLVDVPLDLDVDRSGSSEPSEPQQSRVQSQPTMPQPTAPQPSMPRARKGRVSMPSWDDIVFGARPDDLA